MAVTIIEQHGRRTWIINGFIRILMAILRTVLLVIGKKSLLSKDIGPHDASKVKPKNLEERYGVNVSRMELPKQMAANESQRNWAPWKITPPPSIKVRRSLIFYPGGGFAQPTMDTHWLLMARLAVDLEAEVYLQAYSLVPHAGVHENMEQLIAKYCMIQERAQKLGHELLVGGDSAGGSVAAAVVLALHDRKKPLPDQIILMCPVLTADITTPANKDLESVDAMLTIDWLQGAFRAWALGPMTTDELFAPVAPFTNEEKTKLDHPYASPLLGDWEFLNDAHTSIVLIHGTYDLLLPQAEAFVKICQGLDVDMTYIRGLTCGHGYIHPGEFRGSQYFAPSAREGVDMVITAVKRQSKIEQ